MHQSLMGNVRVFPDLAALSRAAAAEMAAAMTAALAARGAAHIALSGGSTPAPLFRLLAAPPHREDVPWRGVHVWWGDERAVPPDDHQSNYALARTLLLDHVPVPPEHVHRVRGELSSAQAAVDYAARLRAHAGAGRAWPRFDVALLGLGADGHTASLFPGPIPAAEVESPVVHVTAHYEDRHAERVSLTPLVFDDARLVIFLAAGAAKASALAAVLSGPHEPEKWPAQRIRPDQGKVIWMVDEAAARLWMTRC